MQDWASFHKRHNLVHSRNAIAKDCKKVFANPVDPVSELAFRLAPHHGEVAHQDVTSHFDNAT
jgi:hypothetical protein